MTPERERLTAKPALFETYLGIPRMLTQLEGRIFEGLPEAEARQWPQRFAAAVQTGADLSGVWNQFAPWLLREIALPAVAETQPKIRAAIIAVAEGFETNWATLSPLKAREEAFDASLYKAPSIYADTDAWPRTIAAANAANAAALAADGNAFYAAHYASAAYAYAGRRAPANLVETSITSAHQDAFSRMADKLCELMAAEPMT